MPQYPQKGVSDPVDFSVHGANIQNISAICTGQRNECGRLKSSFVEEDWKKIMIVMPYMTYMYKNHFSVVCPFVSLSSVHLCVHLFITL